MAYLHRHQKEAFDHSLGSTRQKSVSPAIGVGQSWNRHHTCCLTDNSTLLRAELNAKQLKIAKLQDQMETKKRKIAEMSAELSMLKDKSWRKIIED